MSRLSAAAGPPALDLDQLLELAFDRSKTTDAQAEQQLRAMGSKAYDLARILGRMKRLLVACQMPGISAEKTAAHQAEIDRRVAQLGVEIGIRPAMAHAQKLGWEG